VPLRGAPPSHSTMDYRPPLRTGLLIGLVLLSLSLAGTALGLAQVGRAPLSPWLVLWTLLPLLGVPAAMVVGYRLYGLLTARYRINRNGLRLRWGLRVEEAPLSDVVLRRVPEALHSSLQPRRGLWWPGCVVGERQVDGIGRVEFLSTRPASEMLLVSTAGRTLAISPPKPQAFLDAFVQATRLGSLEMVVPVSRRPEFFSARLWEDRAARWLILLGLALPIGLLGYLGVSSTHAPALVPFGFDPAGQPSLLAPPSRLLFLPLSAGLCWVLDAVLGSFLYRSERDRLLAYGVWGLAVLVGILFWGAALQLVAAA